MKMHIGWITFFLPITLFGAAVDEAHVVSAGSQVTRFRGGAPSLCYLAAHAAIVGDQDLQLLPDEVYRKALQHIEVVLHKRALLCAKPIFAQPKPVGTLSLRDYCSKSILAECPYTPIVDLVIKNYPRGYRLLYSVLQPQIRSEGVGDAGRTIVWKVDQYKESPDDQFKFVKKLYNPVLAGHLLFNEDGYVRALHNVAIIGKKLQFFVWKPQDVFNRKRERKLQKSSERPEACFRERVISVRNAEAQFRAYHGGQIQATYPDGSDPRSVSCQNKTFYFGAVSDIALDDEYLYVASKSCSDIAVVDIKTLEIKYWLKGHKKPVAAFLVNGKYLYSAAQDGLLCIWKKPALEPLLSIPLYGVPTRLAIDNVNQYLYVGLESGSIKVFSTQPIELTRCAIVAFLDENIGEKSKAGVDVSREYAVWSKIVDAFMKYDGLIDQQVQLIKLQESSMF